MTEYRYGDFVSITLGRKTLKLAVVSEPQSLIARLKLALLILRSK